MNRAVVGLIGLGTMGSNLARNLANHEIPTVVYNRTTKTMRSFVAEFGSELLFGEKDLKSFVKSIRRPRKIIILVQAGPAVDAVLSQLTPLLDKGDVVLDCGNSNFHDTIRREDELRRQEIHFMGCGVSGGEEGALKGPSLMPGGSKEAWKNVRPILEKIAARDFSGGPCVTHIGTDGAGHYVKMVHNGIEYGVMEMMAEAYELLRSIYRLKSPQIADVFKRYNRGELESYLFEIAVQVLQHKDDLKRGYLVDAILDRAEQKGTGQWTAIDALERGVPLPSISAAVTARVVSSRKELRQKFGKLYRRPKPKAILPLKKFTTVLESALLVGLLISYAQGYDLIQSAAAAQKWRINLAEISRIWEGGCIIRAQLLNTLHKAYSKHKDPVHLFEVSELRKILIQNVPHLRSVVAHAAQTGVPVAGLSASLSYFESMTSASVSANLIQGLRDYFGAHTYQRNDRKGTFHTDWPSSL